MQNLRGRAALRQPSNLQTAYEDFNPTSDWTHDSTGHILLLDLPGFKKEELRLQVDNMGNITISGERRVTGNKVRRFRQVFKAPEDANFEKVSGKFEHGLLFVTMPKKVVAKKEEPPKEATTSAAAAAGASVKEEEKKTEEPEKLKDEKRDEAGRDAVKESETDQGVKGKDTEHVGTSRDEGHKKAEVKEEAKGDKGSREEKKEEVRKEGGKIVEEEVRGERGSREEKKEEVRKEVGKIVEKEEVRGEKGSREEKKMEMKDEVKAEKKEDLKGEKKKREENIEEMKITEGEKIENKEDVMGEKGSKKERRDESKREEIQNARGGQVVDKKDQKEDGIKGQEGENREKEGIQKTDNKSQKKVDVGKKAEGEKKTEDVTKAGSIKRQKGGINWDEMKERIDDGKRWLETDFIENVLQKARENKALIATALAAFSVGIFVSRKLKLR